MSFRIFASILVTVFGFCNTASAIFAPQLKTIAATKKLLSPEQSRRLKALTYADVRPHLVHLTDNQRILNIWDEDYKTLASGHPAPLFFQVVGRSPLPEDQLEMAGSSTLCILALAYTLNTGGPALDMNGRPQVLRGGNWVTRPLPQSSSSGGGKSCKPSSAVSLIDQLTEPEETQLAGDTLSPTTVR